MMFRCSAPLTQRPRSSTHTHTHSQYACMHPIVVHMQVVVYLHSVCVQSLIVSEETQKQGQRRTCDCSCWAAWSAATIAAFQRSETEKSITVTTCKVNLISSMFRSFFSEFKHRRYQWLGARSTNALQMCLASQPVVLGTAALVKCHKYFPLFRNGWSWRSGCREKDGERERGSRRWMNHGGGQRRS